MVRSYAALTAAALLLLAGLRVPALAQAPAGVRPALDAVFPAGGQRGSTVSISARGQSLEEPVRVLVGGDGVEVASIRAVGSRETAAVLKIAAGARPGIRTVRVAGARGLTDPAWFVVGTLPEGAETEPNDDAASATPAAAPVVVNGTLGREADVDCYRFHARAGQRCVAAVEAYRLDSQVKAGDRWQFTVPVVEIRDAAGRVVAAASQGHRFEPALCFTVPADGDYIAEVHDLAYLGGDRGVYRLTLGDVPYPTALVPAGARRGERTPVHVAGLNLPSPAVVEFAAAVPGTEWLLPFPAAGRVLPFVVGDLPERMEAEPNDLRGNPMAVPGVFNGCLDRKGDEDRFEVALRRNDALLIDVTAGRALRSPLDLVLAVRDPAGKVIAENDDSPFTLEETRLRADSLSGDPRLEFVAPESGTYTFALRDLAGRGCPEGVYRATVTPLAPGFSLASRYDNPSLPGPGGTGAVFVTLRRWGGFAGPVRVRPVGLPPGFAGGEAVFPARAGGAGNESAAATITAASDAQPGAIARFRMEGWGPDGHLRADVEPLSPVGDNYRTIPFFRTTDGFTACVLAPGALVLSTPVREVRGAEGDRATIPLEIRRASGSTGELTLVALRGHRLAMGAPVRVPANATRFDFPLELPAAAGESSIVICPPPDGDYRWHRVDACTPSITLIVAPRGSAPPAAVCEPPAGQPRPAATAAQNPVRTPRLPEATPGGARPAAPAKKPARSGAPSFVNDVVPALTRAGCNQGTCHGAAAGRGGLRLSLLGYAPDSDYRAIAREGEGRRVSRVDPGISLLLRKPTLQLPHGGGLRLPPGNPALAVLRAWLQAGAPGPLAGERRLAALAAAPADRLMHPGERLRLRVWAAFDDGSRREVTIWTRFSTSQPGVAGVDPDGTVTAGGPGEAAVMVRYQSRVAAATVSVPFPPPPRGSRRAEPDSPAAAASSPLDALIEKCWQRLGLRPSGECTDAEFIRRVMLDAIGTLPTPAEVEEFLAGCDTPRGASPSAASACRASARDALVDRVLDRPEWVDYWALYFGDLLRNNREVVGDSPMWAFRAWLRDGLRQDRPLPEMLRELVAAPGSLRENPALCYFSTSKTPEELAETTSQVLLGVRLQCAKCHNHPFERWTQDDYFSFAAFFARINIKGTANLGKFGGDMLVLTASEGEVRHPRTGQPLVPRPLAGSPLPSGSAERLPALGEWLADPANPFVARSFVNRIWARLMGRGLVEPVDDFRASNPPTNPALLAALTRDFAAHGYRLKPLMRSILRLRAYRLSGLPTPQNVADDRFYSHYAVRRLGAEPLLDAVGAVTGIPERFSGMPGAMRAIALPDNLHGSYFLETFGRPARVAVCECERDSEPNLTQTLHLLNGSFLQDKIAAPNGRIASMLSAGAGVPEVVRALYLAAYGRPPGRKERETVLGLIAEAPTPREGLEDLLWTLLNSREFLLNH